MLNFYLSPSGYPQTKTLFVVASNVLCTIWVHSAFVCLANGAKTSIFAPIYEVYRFLCCCPVPILFGCSCHFFFLKTKNGLLQIAQLSRLNQSQTDRINNDYRLKTKMRYFGSYRLDISIIPQFCGFGP